MERINASVIEIDEMGLSVIQRRVLALHFKEKSTADIAVALGVEASTIRTILARIQCKAVKAFGLSACLTDKLDRYSMAVFTR